MRIGAGPYADPEPVLGILGGDVLPVSEDGFQDALLSGDIDAYVARYDRIPQGLDRGISLAAVLRRGPSGFSSDRPLEELPCGSRIRICSELAGRILSGIRPDLVPADDGYSATISPSYISGGYPLDEEVFIGAPAQGCVAVFIRKDDEAAGAVRSLNHMPSRTEAEAERGLMNLLGAVPGAPFGARAEVVEDSIRIRAASYCYGVDGRRCDEYIPIDYVMDEILGIAEYLGGKRDDIV